MTEDHEYVLNQSLAWNALHAKDDKVQAIQKEIERHQGRLTTIPTLGEYDATTNRIKLLNSEIERLDSLARESIKEHGSVEPLRAALAGELVEVVPPTDNNRHAQQMSAETQPLSARQKTRTDALKQAMFAGLAAYEVKFRTKPTARALFDWLANNDETGIIEDYNQKSDSIIWRGATGKFHDTSFKSFEGRFTKIKKSRVYPG